MKVSRAPSTPYSCGLFRHYAEHRTFYRRLDEGGGLQVHLAVQAYVSGRIGSSSLFAANALQHDEEDISRWWRDGVLENVARSEQHSAPDAAESGAAELGRLIRIYASALMSDSPEPSLRTSARVIDLGSASTRGIREAPHDGIELLEARPNAVEVVCLSQRDRRAICESRRAVVAQKTPERKIEPGPRVVLITAVPADGFPKIATTSSASSRLTSLAAPL